MIHNNIIKLFYLSIFICFSCSINLFAADGNGYVRASGKSIVDPNGENLIFRGIGTGNWMLQEGYMMNSSDVAPAMWKFKELLTKNIGKDKTDEFYKLWYDNHFTEQDVDSMAHWGYNCVRVALHYKMFTLPIEDEPVKGEQTWLNDGFERLDNLLSWCGKNKIYLILDMHGCPGGQGTDAAISDYDSSKPSLWESDLNKDKLVALWKKLAQRYSDSKWIGGYDLINETNWWSFTEPNNKPLRDLMIRMTNAIREVDKNHLLIIEGNSWANDFNGLTPKWDNNMAYSFHKYWTYNDQNSLAWVLELREQNNCPIWLGETGENSNTWFTDVIELCESNNIGWSMWPVKKTGINNILTSDINSDYQDMLTGWKSGNFVSAEKAYNGVMKFAESHKFDNCKINYDVIDAMINRPFRDGTKAFINRKATDIIYASDYDFGRNGEAYYDVDDVNYHLNTDTYTTWNRGYAYRNDGVDIQTCTDAKTNGYSVGYVEDGEWMQYTLNSESEKSYTMALRYASENSNGKVYVMVNGKRASKDITLTSSGGWSKWKNIAINNIIIPAGEVKIRLVFEKGSANVNYFQLVAPQDVDNAKFEVLDITTDILLNKIDFITTKAITKFNKDLFDVKLNGISAEIGSIAISNKDNRALIFTLNNDILSNHVITISCKADGCCESNADVLGEITNNSVKNRMKNFYAMNDIIQAENFITNSGFEFEKCEDVGGGLNTSYAEKFKYLDYPVFTEKDGEYNVSFRVAVNASSSIIRIHSLDPETNDIGFLNAIKFNNTGGWQNWNTVNGQLKLKKGKNIIRIEAYTPGFNFNWWRLDSYSTGVSEKRQNNNHIFYNKNTKDIGFTNTYSERAGFEMYNIMGKCILRESTFGSNVDCSSMSKGIYIARLILKNEIIEKKIIIE